MSRPGPKHSDGSYTRVGVAQASATEPSWYNFSNEGYQRLTAAQRDGAVWKIHISVDPEKIVAAREIIHQAIFEAGELSILAKGLSDKQIGDGDIQPGKEFAIIVAQGDSGDRNLQKWQRFLQGIAQKLSGAGIGMDPRPINSDPEQARRKWDAKIFNDDGSPSYFNYRSDIGTILEDFLYEMSMEPGGDPDAAKVSFTQSMYDALPEDQRHAPTEWIRQQDFLKGLRLTKPIVARRDVGASLPPSEAFATPPRPMVRPPVTPAEPGPSGGVSLSATSVSRAPVGLPTAPPPATPREDPPLSLMPVSSGVASRVVRSGVAGSISSASNFAKPPRPTARPPATPEGPGPSGGVSLSAPSTSSALLGVPMARPSAAPSESIRGLTPESGVVLVGASSVIGNIGVLGSATIRREVMRREVHQDGGRLRTGTDDRGRGIYDETRRAPDIVRVVETPTVTCTLAAGTKIDGVEVGGIEVAMLNDGSPSYGVANSTYTDDDILYFTDDQRIRPNDSTFIGSPIAIAIDPGRDDAAFILQINRQIFDAAIASRKSTLVFPCNYGNGHWLTLVLQKNPAPANGYQMLLVDSIDQIANERTLGGDVRSELLTQAQQAITNSGLVIAISNSRDAIERKFIIPRDQGAVTLHCGPETVNNCRIIAEATTGAAGIDILRSRSEKLLPDQAVALRAGQVLQSIIWGADKGPGHTKELPGVVNGDVVKERVQRAIAARGVIASAPPLEPPLSLLSASTVLSAPASLAPARASSVSELPSVSRGGERASAAASSSGRPPRGTSTARSTSAAPSREASLIASGPTSVAAVVAPSDIRIPADSAISVVTSALSEAPIDSTLIGPPLTPPPREPSEPWPFPDESVASMSAVSASSTAIPISLSTTPTVSAASSTPIVASSPIASIEPGPSLDALPIASAVVSPAARPVVPPFLNLAIITSSDPIISRPSVAPHPSAPTTSHAAISFVAPPTPLPPRPAASRLPVLGSFTRPDARLLPNPPSSILTEPNYDDPVKARYDTDIEILKKLAAVPNADKKEAALRSRMKKDYIVVNHEDENINFDEAKHNISFEVNFLHRNEAGDLTTVSKEVNIEIGDLCAISKDETGKPKVVLDRDKAKKNIRDYYFSTSDTPVPLTAVKVLFARQLIDGRGVEGAQH